MTACAYCGESTTNPKFCNLTCTNRFGADKRRGVPRSTRLLRPSCRQCGREVPSSRHVFCNRSCAGTFNGHAFPKRGNPNKPKRTCLYCGKPIKSEKYCAGSCQGQYQYETYIKAWLLGENSGSENRGERTQYVVRWVREKYDEKCSLCGWGEVRPCDGRIPVQIDHIDGCFSNNRPENLRLLCPNCHSLTSTFGRLNSNGGRTYRYAYTSKQADH